MRECAGRPCDLTLAVTSTPLAVVFVGTESLGPAHTYREERVSAVAPAVGCGVGPWGPLNPFSRLKACAWEAPVWSNSIGCGGGGELRGGNNSAVSLVVWDPPVSP